MVFFPVTFPWFSYDFYLLLTQIRSFTSFPEVFQITYLRVLVPKVLSRDPPGKIRTDKPSGATGGPCHAECPNMNFQCFPWFSDDFPMVSYVLIMFTFTFLFSFIYLLLIVLVLIIVFMILVFCIYIFSIRHVPFWNVPCNCAYPPRSLDNIAYVYVSRLRLRLMSTFT